jgi:hypothetical protein
VEKAILVYPERDKDGNLWWLVHTPKTLKKKGLPKTKGPIYMWEQWKLLRTIVDLSEESKPA